MYGFGCPLIRSGLPPCITVTDIVRYAVQEQQGGGAGDRRQERRREGGTRERGEGRKRALGLLVVRQEELTVGDRGMRWKEACYGGRA